MMEFWWGLDPRRRAGLVLGAATVLALVAGLSIWIFRVQYAVLFSGLSETDAATIVEQLDAFQVRYKLSDQGATIMVPEQEVYSTRLRLTSSGALVKGGVGFELFDEAEYGMTDFAQKINYQRALQGELARTIAALDKIKHARVHLVLPESSLFRKKNMPASAAITLMLRDKAVLDEQEIRGIQELVAASVQDLQLENITIVDQRSNILSSSAPESSRVMETRLDEKLRLESHLQEKIQPLLDGVFGHGNGVVEVSVDINYDQVQRRIERELPAVDDTGKPLVSRRSTTKSVKPGSAPTGGAERGQIPVANATNEVSELEYRFGRSVEEQVLESGDISRISISAMVPDFASVEEIERLRRLISAAVGLDSSRGDMLEVEAMSQSRLESVLSQETAPGVAADSFSRPDAQDEIDTLVASDRSGLQVSFGSRAIPADLGILALVATISLLLIVLFLVAVSRRSRMTATEREELLGELRDWLSQPEVDEAQRGRG